MPILGIHKNGTGGQVGNLGGYIERLGTAGKQFFVVSPEDAALANLVVKVGGIAVFRKTAWGAEPDYHLSPLAAAQKRWTLIKATMPPELDRRVWLQYTIEPDKERANWVLQFAYHLSVLANAEGWRVCGPNWSTGTPEIDAWESEGGLLFLRYCAKNRDKCALAIHEYSLDANDIQSVAPWLVGRFQFVLDVCDDHGISHPRILITEFGWAYNDCPDPAEAMRQLTEGRTLGNGEYLPAPVELYGDIPIALWTVGTWQQGPSLPGKLAPILVPLTEYMLAHGTSVAESEEKDMPGLNYKSIVILLPQNATLDHILQVRRDEYANRRTITQSLDEAARLRQLGEEGSYIIAYDLEEWSEAEQALILAGPHKLRRLTPEKLFAVPLASDNWTILPGGKFDAPRDYRSINPHVKQRHEGLDFSATAGGLIAIAPRDGVVEARGYKADGYGYWVRLRHDLPGVTYKTWVAHMAGPAEVAPGQTVKRAQRLGLVGSTGNSTGVHVHFTVQKIPGGLSGYIVDSVVDPEPLTDLTPIAAPYNPVPAPPAPPPTQPSVDMAQFFLPAAGNYGDIVILKNNWGQGDERQQLQRDGNISFVTKNQQYERRIIGGDRITLDLDTSPGDDEFYRVESSTGWMPRYWQPGETFSRTETARFYRKDNCEAVNKVLSGTSILRFVALHGSYTTRAGVTFNTVAEMVWERNGAVEERYWYAKGCGLIAWKNRHGRESWAVEQIPLGQQKSNNREIIPCA